MEIAICLYGQPRNYEAGYHNILKFIELNTEHKFTFFIHCWIDDNIKLEASPWRKIDENTLIISDSNIVKNDILEKYKPENFIFEKPKKEFECEYEIKISKVFEKSPEQAKKNYRNILSQMYSRNMVKNLLENYSEKKNKKYDFVVAMRMDFCRTIDFKISEAKKGKVYVSNILYPRKIMPDNLSISPQDVFENWFNMYVNIPNIINNKSMIDIMDSIKEPLTFNMEQIVMANYLHYNYSVDDIVYHKEIPNFI